MLTWRCFFLAVIILLVGTTSALSQDTSTHKSVRQNAHSSEPKKPSLPASAQQSKREVVPDQEAQPPSHTAEKLEIDRKLAEYTRQLADYTKELSDYTGDVSLFTLLLFLATVLLGGVSAWQGFHLKRTVDLARQEFISTHRPEIIVRRVSLDTVKGVGLPDSQKIQFIIANVGRTTATIREISATVLDSKNVGTLPAIPPYEDSIPLQMSLKPGASCPYPLHLNGEMAAQVNFQDGFGAETSIYLLGYIQYQDELNEQYRTAFFRCYHGGKKRFITVDDPEYEYQD